MSRFKYRGELSGKFFTIKLSRARPKVSMTQGQGCNVSVVGSHPNVTVNSQDQVTPVTPGAIMTTPNLPRPGHVIITPLANATSLTLPSTTPVIAQSTSNFCQQTTPGQLVHELQSMGHQATMPTESIGSKLLLKAVSPLNKSRRPSPFVVLILLGLTHRISLKRS